MKNNTETSKIASTPKKFGKLKVAALGLVAMISLTGCTSISTNSDEIGIYYKAGSFTSVQFDRCVTPGTLELWKGVGDDTYTYPAGRRTYTFSNSQQNAESPALQAPTKEPVYLDIEGYITFNLTDNCESLQAFHESIGLRYEAWNSETSQTSEGWMNLLHQYIGSTLQEALTKATGEYGWKEIYENPKVSEEWKKKVTSYLPIMVKNAMGGDFFENFNITIQKPILPETLRNASQTREVAKTEKEAQEAKNDTIRKELEAIRDVVKVVGRDNYVLLEAAKNDKVSVIGVPSGSGLAITSDGTSVPKK